jgi:hypothetical protein
MIVVINDDAGMGKAGGGRAGLESNEFKAKISGLSVASNFARTCLNRFFFNINCLFVAFSQDFEEKKKEEKSKTFSSLLGVLHKRHMRGSLIC